MKFVFDIPERKQPLTQELMDGETWVVLRPFWFIRNNGELLTVPPSGPDDVQAIVKPIWTTDYGSIPQLFQNIFSPVKYGAAYLLHDWLYASEQFSRSECDAILLEALKAQGANWFTRRTIYSAVRAGGWAVWSKHDQDAVDALKAYWQAAHQLYPLPSHD